MGFWDIFKQKYSAPSEFKQKDNVPTEFDQKDIAPLEFNEDELLFYRQLQTKLKLAKIYGKLSYNVLSDKTISFTLDRVGQIGRVKIRGKNKRIQILSKARGHNVNVLWFDVSGVADMITLIDKWIEYAKS